MIRSFVHNVVAHPLWWLLSTLADAAEQLHELTAPGEEAASDGG